MNLHMPFSEIFIPDGTGGQAALPRTTHLAIAAHPDDIEIMAYHGILQCYNKDDCHFTGVVVTNGSGSSRSGAYSNYSDEDMMTVRRREQKAAATVGRYNAQIMLDYPSAAVKNAADLRTVQDIAALVESTRPQVIYTHNLADKHDTHVAVALRAIAALRGIDAKLLPQKLYGCEVWRALDWMCDDDKTVLNVEGHANLESSLISVFDSQIAGGKRYDLAAVGRRLANATFYTATAADATTSAIYAMDLTPLIYDKTLDVCDYVTAYAQRFCDDVHFRIKVLGLRR